MSYMAVNMVYTVLSKCFRHSASILKIIRLKIVITGLIQKLKREYNSKNIIYFFVYIA